MMCLENIHVSYSSVLEREKNMIRDSNMFDEICNKFLSYMRGNKYGN